MTMVNSTTVTTPTSRGGGVSLRKTNKPLMEKRRRARINDSLSQLKSLVIHSSKKDSSQFSKLEKADILELTVKHLRGLQAQQRHQHQQHPLAVQQSVASGPADSLVNGKYTAGFVECANEVMRYLDQSQGFNMETKNKVVSHLAGCLQLVNTSSTQPKVTPHPHQQSISQQPQAPPNAASAILAAAAAAASNGTTTTTQLPNGQIVQIVSNPLQNVVQSANAVPTIVGLNPAAPLQCHGATTTIQGINLSTQSDSQSTHQPTGGRPAIKSHNPIQAAYHINYAQPLHIQIPPIVSPVLIQKCVATNQIKHKESAITNKQFSSSSFDHSHQSMTHDESRDTHSSSSSVSSTSSASSSSSHVSSSSSSLPKNTGISPPPPALYPRLPKVRAQKQLNFNMQDALKFDNSYSTPGKQPTVTPPSSSSSSPSSTSSSEENTSPLNLSQSPSFLQMEPDHHHHSNHSLKSRRDSHSKQQRQSVCPYQVRASLENIDCNNGSRFNTSYLPKSSKSVIVNSQKCVDFTEGKYWSMMEEERHCLRQRNTPSPASSVGEERLWRPW